MEHHFGTLKGKLDRWAVENFAELQTSLDHFRVWYNHVRPHQSLQGRTPAELWTGRDIYQRRPRKALWFEAWDELLTGEYLPPGSSVRPIIESPPTPLPHQCCGQRDVVAHRLNPGHTRCLPEKWSRPVP
ncbi:MAG: integrase core domain-containing protein [Gammaproteobacteria bacterium]